ncbi:unnamed protein product [Rotaria sordida]|uniref:NADH:ubiquinone reductase (non-electrogenic) n=1 Tax=Rotaria sordida TaxID=392033 RepID=A0A815FD13_9BILA|nr:unnamed protein product [Rotaria sordida]
MNGFRNLSLKQLKEFKPIITRNLAWFNRQSNKQSFGTKLKRRLRNLLIVSVIGFGSYYGYRNYKNYKWHKELNESNESTGTKPRIVVLGTGWGAVPFLKHIDSQKYEVVCVSPRNYFLMTPLLPSVSVGTVETRTVIEAIRTLIGPRIKYVEAHCVDIDPKLKIITCNTDEKGTVSRGDDIKTIVVQSKRESGASSRIIKDSARTRPQFDMKYDILIVAIGSSTNTFNIPGVEEHAHFLKEILDARRIRSAISDAFESAMTPTQTEEERKRLLHFIVVGGGPTGVEFAAELIEINNNVLRLSVEILDARRIRSAISDAFESAMTPTQTEEERKRLLHFIVVGGGPTGVEFAAETTRS